MPDVPLGGGGVGSVIDVIVDIHNARKGPPSGVPEQPGYRGPGDVIYDQRQAPASDYDVVSSGILDTPYTPGTADQPVVVNEPPPVAYAPPVTDTQPPIAGEVLYPPEAGAPHDYEGYYDPATEPAPVYRSGVTVEGEYSNVPDVQTGIDRRSPPPRETADDVLSRIGGSVVGRIVGRIAGGPIGTVIEEIATPTNLPPEPDVRGWQGYSFPSGAPAPVMSSTPSPQPYAGPIAPRPERPTLPPVPRGPTVNVPKPDLGASQWPASTSPSTPQAPTGEPFPSPAPPAPVASSPSSSATPMGSTASASQPSSPGSLWQILPWLSPFGSRSPANSASASLTSSPSSPSPSTAPASPPLSSPTPTSSPAPTPTPTPSTLTSGSAPPLTPLKPAAVESPPAGDYCETPQQTKQRRQQKRDQCERFITITIPKHKRRVCASEAGKYIGKKLGKAIGRGVGRVLRGKSFVAPESKRKSARRKEESPVRLGRRGRSVELPGGIGVELPKQLRPNLRIPKLPGAHGP